MYTSSWYNTTTTCTQLFLLNLCSQNRAASANNPHYHREYRQHNYTHTRPSHFSNAHTSLLKFPPQNYAPEAITTNLYIVPTRRGNTVPRSYLRQIPFTTWILVIIWHQQNMENHLIERKLVCKQRGNPRNQVGSIDEDRSCVVATPSIYSFFVLRFSIHFALLFHPLPRLNRFLPLNPQ